MSRTEVQVQGSILTYFWQGAHTLAVNILLPSAHRNPSLSQGYGVRGVETPLALFLLMPHANICIQWLWLGFFITQQHRSPAS